MKVEMVALEMKKTWELVIY